jgi:hypothetical protein
MSQVIIPDEWLIHDLKGDNGKSSQTEALGFLEKVIRKCDRLGILEGAPFASKAYSLLMKDESITVRQLSKYFRLKFLVNTEKCVRVNHGGEVNEVLALSIPPSDLYLFETREAIGEGTIVTSDSDLTGHQWVRMRNEFLAEYGS